MSMTFFIRLAVRMALALFVIGCTADSPSDVFIPEKTAGADTEPDGPSSKVIAALEAAARGDAFEDDIHPESAKTGLDMTNPERAFDVRRYELSIRIMPATWSIDGTVDVTFIALQDLDVIELDLDPDLDINGATMDGVSLTVTRNEDSFTVAFPVTKAADSRATVSISYSGEPHVALAAPWHGGFVWSELDGTPWFATAVQTEGCDLWWPCKDTYADKPDEGVVVAITAPRGVKIASVGVLDGVEEHNDGFDTWRWVSRHPYAGYAIAINGGPYKLVEREYKGINGTTFPIQFWALPENADKVANLIESDVISDLDFFERLLGPYPWGDEKAGFVETPHLGMEHQTINAYGEQFKRGKYGFDDLLHHELAHEWFGNVMTHSRPEDSWIHEGYASYMGSVYAGEMIGNIGYYDRLYDAYVNNEHCLPVADATVGDVSEAFDNRDIYTKGAWMLHTLREYIGDDAFWAGTRRLIYDTAEPWALEYPIKARYRTTEDFTRIMSEEAGEDVAWIVETYLREVGMPKLNTTRAGGQLILSWSVPGGRPFPMPVSVSVDGETTVVDMSGEAGTLEVADTARIVIDPESKVLRDLPIIGDCSEQTSAQIDRNIERFTRMAKEYGWRRN